MPFTGIPIDTHVEKPVNLMEVMPGDNVETPIWDTYKEIIAKYDDRGAQTQLEILNVLGSMMKQKKVYAVIATGETASYANIMLQKGVVVD